MCYGYHIWSKEVLMQAENDDDLDGGQRSSEVKWGKLCDMATIFDQKNWRCTLRMMMTLMEVKGHQRSNIVTCAMATIFGQKNCWCKLRMMMTFTEVKGHQRSNVVNYATKLGRKSSWCKFRMTVTFMEVKGQQRSNTVNNICSLLPIWYLVSRWGLGPKVCMYHFGCGMN